MLWNSSIGPSSTPSLKKWPCRSESGTPVSVRRPYSQRRLADVDQVAVDVHRPDRSCSDAKLRAVRHWVITLQKILAFVVSRSAGQRDPVVVQVVHPVVVELHPVAEHVAVVRVDDLAVVDGHPEAALVAGDLDAAGR